MDIELKQRIYNAQCIGNVEPIEYMIPYPSMISLIEGQNIKYGNQLIIKSDNITNLKYSQLIQQTAHWLIHKGLMPKDRIVLPKLKHYQSQIQYLETEEKEEKDLLKKIKKFRQDELEHRDIAYEEGATKEGPFFFLDAIIKAGSRIAIEVAKKI